MLFELVTRFYLPTSFWWALFGALFSFILVLGWEQLHLLRHPRGFFGKWQSSFQQTFYSGWDWVTESLTVQRRFGHVKLKNADNSAGLEWKGTGRIIANRYLSGEWESVKPGAQLGGLFVLVMGADGGYMVGFFFGEEKYGTKLITGFVLGRTNQDVDTGKSILQKTRPMFPTGRSRGGGAG